MRIISVISKRPGLARTHLNGRLGVTVSLHPEPDIRRSISEIDPLKSSLPSGANEAGAISVWQGLTLTGGVVSEESPHFGDKSRKGLLVLE